MIYSKANLKVASVASSDAMHGGLNGVRFESDGSTVAGNGRVMMAVAPVPPEGVAYFPDKAAEQMGPGSGLIMPVDLVKKVLSGMDKGVKGRHSTGYVAMSKMKDMSRVGFTSINAKGDPTTNGSLPKAERFPDWRGVLRRLWPFRLGGAGAQDGWRVCVSRGDLLTLLKAMEEAAPGGGPAIVSGRADGSGIVVRGIALDSKQRVIGAVSSVEVGENWLELTPWERSIFAAPVKKKVRR